MGITLEQWEIDCIEELTEANEHFEARRVIVARMNDHRLAVAYEGLACIHAMRGTSRAAIVNEAVTLRNVLEPELDHEMRRKLDNYHDVKAAL